MLRFKRPSQQKQFEFYKIDFLINNRLLLLFQYTKIIKDIHCPFKYTTWKKTTFTYLFSRSINFHTFLHDLLIVIHSASVSLLAELSLHSDLFLEWPAPDVWDSFHIRILHSSGIESVTKTGPIHYRGVKLSARRYVTQQLKLLQMPRETHRDWGLTDAMHW